MKKIVGFLLVGLILVGCSSAAEKVLTVKGNLPAEVHYSEKDLKGFAMVSADYTNKDGETTTYEGVLILSLLESAKATAYTSIVFEAADGYTAEVMAEELQNCSACIISFQEEGGLRVVMPNFSSKLQVRDLIALEVK